MCSKVPGASRDNLLIRGFSLSANSSNLALVNNPKINFADEPTGNLDSNTGERILQMFDKLHTEGKTVMLVTHEPDIAAVTPRRIEIRDGKIANEIDPKLSGQTPRFNIGTNN